MITVCQAQKSDAEVLCELQKAAFLPIYEQYQDSGNPCLRGVEDILWRLDSDDFKYFTVLDDGEIVGGIFYRCGGRTPMVPELKKGEYYLARIYVKPDKQCQGIGKEAILLCEKEFKDATKFYVDFPQELEKNKKCYINAGFHDTGKSMEPEPGFVLVLYEKSVEH